MAITVTANDEPTEIEADVDKRFSSIVVNLPVRQTGTGTPSPTNPRPFTMWTDVSLYVSDTEEADEPTLSIELPTPLYGGKIDMVRGEIATTYNSKESGTGWEMTQEGQFRCQVSAYNNGDETSTNVADLYAVHYETVSNKDAYDATDDLTCGLATIDGTTYLYVNDAQYTTLDSFATHIAEEVFVFRAHIPMSDVTEPHIVYLPAGTSYVWADAGFVDLTVSGTPPLSLPNSLGKPLKAWEVDVLPKQDLHGYDSPWPAGGGKNILPIDSVYHDDNTGNITIFNGNITGTFTFSADVSGVTSVVAPNAALCSITVDGVNQYDLSFGNLSHTYSGTITSIVVFASGSYTQYRGTVKFQLEAGNTATSWTPYANLCPIHGTDKLNLFVEESYDPTATPKAVLTLPQTVYTGTIGSDGGESRWGAVDLGTIEWNAHGSLPNVYTGWGQNLPRWKILPASGVANALCSEYKLTTSAPGGVDAIDFSIALGTGISTAIYVHNSAVANINEFITAISGVQLAYELETPTTFSVPSVTIPTPTGTATTWATAEDGTVESMEVTYVGKA